MKNIKGCLVFSLSAAVGLACGGSTTVSSGDAGTGASSGSGGSGASSGAGGSGAGGSGASGGAGVGGSGVSESGGGTAGSGNGPVMGDCPSCTAPQVCCLAPAGGQLQGTCAASAAACPGGSDTFACMQGSDCSGGQQCCVTVGSAGAPTSTVCAASCPAGTPPACGGAPSDNTDCPGGATGWECQALPGMLGSLLGLCVAVPVPDAGSSPPDSGSTGVDAGTAPDASEAGAPLPVESGSPSQDAAAGG